MSIKNNIPSLDLNDFNSKDPNKKNDFVKNLGKAYEKIGFVAIENHGLSDEFKYNGVISELKRSHGINPLRES